MDQVKETHAMRLYNGLFIVPTLPRGNASGDAPASRFIFVGMYR